MEATSILLISMTHFPLFVGQEVVEVAAPADEIFPLQTLQRGRYLVFEGDAVGIDFIDAKSHQVIDIWLENIDVADQERGS